MNQKVLTLALSKVLCYASRNTQECWFCENGQCTRKMSDTFIPEAQACLQFLVSEKIVPKSKLIN